MTERPDAILIAGPTASGKSSIAIDLARRFGGVVVNADASQVYKGLRILSARPDEHDLAKADHVLYGHVEPDRAYSVAEWLDDVSEVLADLRIADKVPVITGGTGLYFKALTEGLSEVPAPEPDIRAFWREVSQKRPQVLHGELARRDPASAARLRPTDTQRLVRALEVLESTGEPLSVWHSRVTRPPLIGGGRLVKHVIELPRPVLHRRIGERLQQMVEAGAVDEVRNLLELGLSPLLPAMKAIGVREFTAYIQGETTLEEACEAVKTATRQYAKRQSTWFRNQMDDDWRRGDSAVS